MAHLNYPHGYWDGNQYIYPQAALPYPPAPAAEEDPAAAVIQPSQSPFQRRQVDSGGGESGGPQFGDDFQYNPDAIMALDNAVPAAAYALLPFGSGTPLAMNASQANDIRDDQMFGHMNSGDFTAPNTADYANSVGRD